MADNDIKKIMDALPQGYPFVLIDRILELVPDERIVVVKNVTACEPWFGGHFPDNPVMPGVLVVEAMCQAGALLVNLSDSGEAAKKMHFLAGMDNVRFRRQIIPGDVIVIDARITKKKFNVVRVEASASVEGKRAAEARLMASIGGINDTSNSNS